MQMTPTDRELDLRLRAQAHPDPILSEGACRAVVAQAEGAAKSKSRRFRVSVIASAAALVAVAVPSAAIANTLFSAQTGIFNATEKQMAEGNTAEEASESGEDTVWPGSEGSPGAEWIDMSSSDLDGFIASRAPRDIPLPAGVSWDDALDRFFERFDQEEYVASNDLGGGGQIMAESLVIDTMLENTAKREWLTAWFAAHESGDVEAMNEAGGALERSVDWPAERASTRGAYAEQMREWARLIAGGDYDAAQAYAQYYEWTDLHDGVDRNVVSDEIFSGARTAQAAEGSQ